MYFLDTSAIAKRYVMEIGTPWIKSLLPTDFMIATITYTEFRSALARRAREGTLLHDDHTNLVRLFEYDMQHRFQLIEITRQICREAGDLAEKHGLRAYDSIQLACAKQANNLAPAMSTTIFITADKNLLAAGLTEGLRATTPEDH